MIKWKKALFFVLFTRDLLKKFTIGYTKEIDSSLHFLV